MSEKIVIVGAGASGLMTARLLSARGIPVTIVEARDRIGGRIHTLTHGTSVIEEGAEFIHGHQPLTFSLAGKAGSQIIAIEGKRYQKWNGMLAQGDIFDDAWEHLIRSMNELSADIDIQTFLDRRFSADRFQALRKKVRSFVEGYDAADLQRVSTLALRKEWEGGGDEPQYRIAGGYSKLMHFLEKSIKQKGGTFIFSSIVREIRWAEGEVLVITENGKKIQGQKAIITVPLGVIMRGRISFNPGLKKHQEAFGSLGFGGVIKVFFEFDQAFWEDHIRSHLNNFSFIFTDGEIPTWWSQLPDKAPLLTGWLGGPSTEKVTQVPGTIYQMAVRSLQYIVGRPIPPRSICHYHEKNWLADPHASGAYAYPTVGSDKIIPMLKEPINKTLYFAGEALYQGPAAGTVEAALSSGVEVANQIISTK